VKVTLKSFLPLWFGAKPLSTLFLHKMDRQRGWEIGIMY